MRGKNWQIGTEVTHQGDAKTAEKSRSQAGTEGAKRRCSCEKQNRIGFALGACCPPSLPRQLALCLNSVKR
jgi:hypothetical protein